MYWQDSDDADPTLYEGVRTLLLLMPRIVGRIKRTRVPDELASFDLAPRHLSLLAFLLLDGELSGTDLASRLEIAPATVSLMVSDLSRRGILVRREDEADRRRTLVSIAPTHHAAVDNWLSQGARAWKTALEPLTQQQRRIVVEALAVYERELSAG